MEHSSSMQQDDAQKEMCDHICHKYDVLKSERTNWETHWQECLEYIVPRKDDVTVQKTPGDKRGQFYVYDTSAIMANQLLAGALHGMLTNPAVRFFELIMGNPALDSDEVVRGWLQEVAERMFITLNNSNFQTEIHETYIDLGAIGTSCLFMGEHDDNVIHFSARPMKEIFLEENNLGLVDTVLRLFKWNPKQIIQEFGYKNVHPWILEQHEKGCTDKFEIIHCVMPADMMRDMDSESEGEGKPAPMSKIFPHKSCYILKEKNLMLSEGGFKEFPYAVPRWTKTTGETYGRGPGMEMLPDIKMVNEMMKTVIRGAQKTVDPPLMVADDGVIGKVRLTPGGLTVVRPTMEVPIRPLITDARIDFGYQAVEDVRKRIRAGFYVDQLQLNDGPQMTATEVMQRTEEKLRLMGPVLGRQHYEFLRPVIERLFGIMIRKKLLPPAPKQIQGKKFDVRYSSLIARSQRMSEGQNFTRAITTASPIANADPKVLDNINGDESLKYIFDVFGVPHKLLRSKMEVDQLRQGRAQAQQAAVQQQQEAHQADVANKTMPGMAQMVQAGAQKGM